MRKAFDWKRSRISMLEVEAVPQSCILYVLTVLSFGLRSLLFVESFDLRRSNQYNLVRVIPSCFHIVKMCLCQVSLLSRCSPRYLTSFWGVAHCLFERFFSCCECDVDRFASVNELRTAVFCVHDTAESGASEEHAVSETLEDCAVSCPRKRLSS
jgi:hypothetical protein